MITGLKLQNLHVKAYLQFTYYFLYKRKTATLPTPMLRHVKLRRTCFQSE